MYKGIYIALSGAVLKQTQLDVIAQNLSNVNTLGYKKDGVSFKDYLLRQFTGEPDGRTMTELSEIVTDFSAGNVLETGNPLDIAIEGDGFLSLEGGKYTRRGDLRLDSDGYLVTYGGTRVMGANGPIQLPDGKVEISPVGEVSVDGALIDTIKIVDFEDTEALLKAGEEFFTTDRKGVKAGAFLKQGYLEASNVDAVKEMTKMISTLREFEAYQKVMHAFDEATSKVTNDMGRM
jgi:flagellar basal-body rod protein FlgF